MRLSWLSLSVCCWTTAFVPWVGAAEPDPTEQAAKKLMAATVTVRMLPAKTARQADGAELTKKPAGQNGAPFNQAPDAALQNQQAAQVANEAGQNLPATEGVTVCSGVSVGRGLIVTFSPNLATATAAQTRFRITLPDGEQTRATLRVIDHYSGLSLLDIDAQDLPVLELAEGAPRIGAAAITAAAAGIEPPIVSQGIIGGVDRALGATGLPPLLQCDVRTTENSAGAAVVDRSGRLLGIIVATPLAGEHGGWSYAAPARHLRRLIDARVADKVVIIERHRPSVGLTMGPGAKEGAVEVERVTPGGPAAKAGIRQGDLILEAEGRKIRSAYQAIDLIVNRQPGEKITLTVQQGDRRRTLEVTLGGAAPVALGANQAAPEAQQAYVGPQVNVRRGQKTNQIEFRNYAEQADVAGNRAGGNRAAVDEVGMLKTQLAAFEKVIARLQEDLRNRELLERETERLVKSLREEVQQLRKEHEAKK